MSRFEGPLRNAEEAEGAEGAERSDLARSTFVGLVCSSPLFPRWFEILHETLLTGDAFGLYHVVDSSTTSPFPEDGP